MKRLWFRPFKDDDLNVVDRPRKGKPETFADVELEGLLNENPCQMQEELALGMIKKQGTWVPYELKPRDVERRFFACE